MIEFVERELLTRQKCDYIRCDLTEKHERKFTDITCNEKHNKFNFP